MKKRIAQIIRKRKKNIAKRIDRNTYPAHQGPVLKTPNIQYDLSERHRGFAYGGIGVVQAMVRQLQLEQLINQNVHVFKIHNPYYESDHVLNIAYNILCQGDCLEDIERLRNDEAYLDALGAVRIPDAIRGSQRGKCIYELSAKTDLIGPPGYACFGPSSVYPQS